jgi:hypothetical protein
MKSKFGFAIIGYYFNLMQQLLFDDKKRGWDFCSGDFYTDIPNCF